MGENPWVSFAYSCPEPCTHTFPHRIMPLGMDGRTFSPSEAGERIGLSKRRILQMIGRGEIEASRDQRGYWRIPEREVDRLQRERRDRRDSAPVQGGELVEELRDRLRYVEDQLRAEREAHAEARRLLLAALERIPPALEAPQETTPEPRESPESAEREPGRGVGRETPSVAGEGRVTRPWWRRVLGG